MFSLTKRNNTVHSVSYMLVYIMLSYAISQTAFQMSSIASPKFSSADPKAMTKNKNVSVTNISFSSAFCRKEHFIQEVFHLAWQGIGLFVSTLYV